MICFRLLDLLRKNMLTLKQVYVILRKREIGLFFMPKKGPQQSQRLMVLSTLCFRH